MARSLWSGAITFGLVSIPVKLYSAVVEKGVRFHLLHDEDGARIREKRVCSAEGTEVPYEHIVKGYEVARGRYVMLTPEELAALGTKATRTIDIEDFVDLSQVDPLYYDRGYYVIPDVAGKRPYALLLQTMQKMSRVAIARMVLREKQHLCAVRPLGNVLALSMMHWSDEVVPVENLEELPASASVPLKSAEVSMAERLVESLAADFHPEKYKDNYRERVLELVERKAQGEAIEAPPEEVAPAQVIDLMEALKASLASQQRGESKERVRRSPAHRTARPRRGPARPRKSA